jgi:hypothetical protein
VHHLSAEELADATARHSLLTFGLLLIGGTVLALIFAAWFGQMLEGLFPNGGIAVFATYFAVHIVSLLGVWAVTIRWVRI